MRVTKYGHSCLRIEREGAVIVIDPGFMTEPAAVDGADAVLITHEHIDHVDIQKLVDAVHSRPSFAVYTHPDVVPKLTEFAGAIHEVRPGDSFTAAGFPVRAFGGLHAVIHPDLPQVANVCFLVEGEGGHGGVYHPGDSFDLPDGADVETLFVPVAGPWLKIAEAVDFVRAIKPHRAYALHDGILNGVGHQVVTGTLKNLAGCEYDRLEPGTALPA